MKKNSNIISNTLLAILLSFLFFSFIFLVLVTSNDELWNFQNIYKMINGYKLYTDCNAIITPIFYYLGAIFLDIFSAKYITFRVYNVITIILLLVIVYKILKKLDLSKNLLLAYLSFFFLLMFQVFIAGANYNTLACLFILLGMYLYISGKSTNLKQGLIIFLVFFTKQNTGVFYALAVLVYELITTKFNLKYIKDQFKKFFFFFIPTSILLLKMYFDNNLFDFINFCFGGLFEFGESNIVFTAAPFYYALPTTTITIYIFTMLKKNTIFKSLKDDFFNTLTFLFVFAIFNTLIIYPIFNSAHFICTFPYHLLFIIYFFDKLILNDLFNDEKYKNYSKYFVALILFTLSIRTLAYFYSDYDSISKYRNRNSAFDGLYSYTERITKTNELVTYISNQKQKGIEVYICSHDAGFPVIELNESHGVYDLLFNGNLGYKGKEKIINDVDTLKNTEFLVVTNEEEIFVQEPKEIRTYIMENLELRGTIHNYSIYSTELTNTDN